MQILELLQRLHQLLKVFQPSGGLWRLIVLPMGGVSAFVQNDLGQFQMSHLWWAIFHPLRAIIDDGIVIHLKQHTARQLRPARDSIDQLGQFRPTFAFDQSTLNSDPRAFNQRHAVLTRRHLNGLLRLVTKTTFGGIYNPLERQIIIGAGHNAEICHRITDLHPLIKARATNNAVRQANGQETILKGPHLMRRAHQNRHLIQRNRTHTTGARLRGFDFFADPTRLFLTVPMTYQADLLALGLFGPQSLAQTTRITFNHSRSRRQNMRG